MKTILIFIFSLFSFYVPAQEKPEVEKSRGCLVNLNKKSLGIDPACKCKESNICFKFNPVKQSEALLEITEKNGKAVYSQNFKNKSRESTNTFNQIIALKAQGKGSSSEIKELYKKLDKLNTEVRKNLLTGHGKYFDQIKSKYKKQLIQTKEREAKLKERIAKYLDNPKSQIDSIKNSLATSAPLSTEKQAADATAKVQNAAVSKVSENQISKNTVTGSSYNSEILEQEKIKELTKQLGRMDLERKDEDSIFDILTKRYLKTYPSLIED